MKRPRQKDTTGRKEPSAPAAGGALRRLGRDEGGFISIVFALSLVALLGLAALVVDLGQLFVVRSELQNASDSGALAGVVELVLSGPTEARDTAVTYATHASHYRLTDPTPGPDAVTVTPVGVDVLQVRVARAVGTVAGGVPTVFARVWSIQTADVEALARAQLIRRVIGSGPGNLLPFAIHEDLADGDGDGTYTVGETLDIYPHQWSPGNFGILDFDGGSNSNDDTVDWIENGYDDSFVIPPSAGHVDVLGDTGISGASMDGPISTRVGDEVLFPIFDEVTDVGANSSFRVVDMVGGVITGFRLTGTDEQRHITMVITDVLKPNLVIGGPSVPNNSTLGTPVLVR